MSTLLCFITYELARNPDVQRKLFEEIASVGDSSGGELPPYETLQKLRYLDMVVSESLRKWPPIAGTDRQCTKPYTMENFDGTVVHLTTDDVVWIQIYGLHTDAQYWPEPEKFDPERFNEENRPNIKPCTFMPFGNGQRACIASRFSLMVAKALCFALIKQYSLEKCDKTPVPLKLKPGTINMMAEGGFWLKFVRRDSTQ